MVKYNPKFSNVHRKTSYSVEWGKTSARKPMFSSAPNVKSEKDTTVDYKQLYKGVIPSQNRVIKWKTPHFPRDRRGTVIRSRSAIEIKPEKKSSVVKGVDFSKTLSRAALDKLDNKVKNNTRFCNPDYSAIRPSIDLNRLAC